jgi:hypothetical protein
VTGLDKVVRLVCSCGEKRVGFSPGKLMEDAKAGGWVCRDGHWKCPRCAKLTTLPRKGSER